MAQPPFPASTNVDGSNPGPNYAQLPDTVQMATGNLWKVGTFQISMTPAALGAGPSITEQTFVGTAATASATQYFPAIGLLPTDVVVVTKAGAQTANVGMLDSRVSAADTLAIKFIASAGTPTPAAGTAAAPYNVTVFRVQPNWTAPVSGNQLDW
jgi:hypothetical protein